MTGVLMNVQSSVFNIFNGGRGKWGVDNALLTFLEGLIICNYIRRFATALPKKQGIFICRAYQRPF